MPSKNILKEYIQGGYYHVYNRGVEKKKIFKSKQDYIVFLRFLKEYLLPPKHSDLLELQKICPRRNPINCYEDIKLLAYCLMPNHFHLFLKQKSEKGLETFMRALSTNYVMYFNQKYNRVGPLFQSRYKAVYIDNEAYYLHISRYIHNNPRELLARDGPLYKYSFSSYQDYLGKRKCDWLNTKQIIASFKNKRIGINSYQGFVEEFNEEKDLDDIVDLILE
ncbi:transposase [Patescibacteria group bacterium]|nr:transposase [Patescibacteria group bacterium]